jgi:ATP-dependent DNA ligase
MPRDPKRNHLAVRTEDHPLEYLTFAGDIPSGNYGAGTMRVWDAGTYELEKASEREVMVVLHGERVSGRHVLFRTDGRNWMIHRMDPPAEPERECVPDTLAPMLPRAVRALPAGEDWAFEVGWGGERAIALVQDGRIRVIDAAGVDITDRVAHLRPLGRQLGSTDAVLDGELVAIDGAPVTYMIADVPWLDGRSLAHAPYRERRASLESLALDGASWQVPPIAVGDADPILAFCRARGLAAVRARRLDGTYRPGVRSADWVEQRIVRRRRGGSG